MSETTNIAWTDSTGSPWFVCDPVDPGCKNCYARELTERKMAPIIRMAFMKAGFTDWRTRPLWGRSATRVLTKGFWTEAPRLNRKAEAEKRRHTMFPSLMDWLDEMPHGCIDQEGKRLLAGEPLARFMDLVLRTPKLFWLCLTKRPGAFWDRMAEASTAADQLGLGFTAERIRDLWMRHIPWHNLGTGVSVCDKNGKSRLEMGGLIPSRMRFASFEPLLEDIALDEEEAFALDWAIVGGESGADRRDCGVPAIVAVHDALVRAQTACFVKQDCAFKPGQQGRIPDAVWARKESFSV